MQLHNTVEQESVLRVTNLETAMANHRILLRARAGAAAVAVLLAFLPAATAAPTTGTPAPVGVGSVEGAAHIDPSLFGKVALGTTTAVLAWDDDEASRAEVGSYLSATGIGFTPLEHLDMAFACVSSDAEVRQLAATPGAISVYGDSTMTPALDKSVPTAFNGDPNDIWGIEGITGEGVGIAVLDTGIDATHPDLQMGSRTLFNTEIFVSSHDYQGGTGDPCPPLVVQQDGEDTESTSGHGTHLASVAAGDGTASAGKYKGMAPGADLIGANVVETATIDRQYSEGGRISLLRVIAGINWVKEVALEEDPTITKVMLLGWTTPGVHDVGHPLSLAFKDLGAFNVSIVMPTGNEGPEQSHCDVAATCHFNQYAAGPYAIAVGATPASSRTRLADYSSRGDPVTYPTYDYPLVYQPLVVAPGSDVTAAKRVGLVGLATLPSDHPLGAGGSKGRSADNMSYQTLSGTSVAAAHVAGTIALMQQAAYDAKGCFLTTQQVRDILQQTASSMPGYAEWEVGAGAIDATSAVWGARFAPKVQTRNWWDCPPPPA